MNGRNIRVLREERGMTLNQLATLSGVSKSYISYIERGMQKNPSIAVLEKLSIALGIEFMKLIESVNEVSKK
ncbi:helix-turn-helix domain-containing protein [Halalkalibacter alkaliphilus]|uniref:Helix-turn-helix domain-containing protein n=1 Tax=Halalkalibacter alkaliphilus TaxID=2917993 RepID=A0A9X2I3L2_9BACI|nr:helix-turn-helix transcriptional regulator [Halalkalibacter alkaliphilus]MCL7747546.1 helix-turn-helix domain-containing protein [Halalkalibacter alkaliphilus]